MRTIQIIGKIGAGKTYLSTLLTNSLSTNGNVVCKLAFANPLKKILNNVGINKIYYPNNKTDYYLDLFRDKSLSLKQKEQLIIRKLAGTIVDELYFLIHEYLPEYDITKTLDFLINELENNTNINIGIQKYYIEKKYYNGCRILMQNIGTILRSINENIFVDYVKHELDILEQIKVVDFVIIDDTRYPNEILDSSFKIKIVNIKDNSDKSNDIIHKHDSELFIDDLPHDLLVLRDDDKYEPSYDTILTKVLTYQELG
jgi:hypothetical protein